MKKNHSLQGGAGILLLASLFLLPTCALRKKAVQKEHSHHQSFAHQTDSLHLTHRMKQEQQFVIHRDEIHLSAPDSSGRQHITSLIRNRIDQQSQATVQDTLALSTSQQIQQKVETSKQQKKTPAPPLSLPYWLWGLCLLFILYLCKRKKFG